MAAIEALANAYGDDSDSEGSESPEEETTADHTAHLSSNVSISQLQSKVQVKSAPVVTAKVGNESVRFGEFFALLKMRKYQMDYKKV